MADPFFSIVVPTYNRKHMIGATLDSVYAQSDDDFELIVVDDGSTDGTSEWIREKYPDRLVLLTVENGERGRARNLGTQHARGRYVYFLDSDDLLYPDHLLTAREFLDSRQGLAWFFQEYEILPHRRAPRGSGSKPKYNPRNPIKTLVRKGNFMSCHGVFVRKDVALEHPFVEDRAMAGSEDYALWLTLAARHPLTINPLTTSALVQHGARSVFNYTADDLIERKTKMMHYVLNDHRFQQKFSSQIPHLKCNTYGYLALHLAMMGQRRLALKYGFKALLNGPSQVFSRRTAATVKHLLVA